jgi:hypothetical protein
VHATREKHKEEAFKDFTTAGIYFPDMCHNEMHPSAIVVAAVSVPETEKSINGDVDISGKTGHILQSDTIGEDGGRSNENYNASLVTRNTIFSRSGHEFCDVLVEGDDVLAVCI